MVNQLSIGTLLESEDATPSHVLASKLNRHTFWCGQSGSGKTYALGVLLEQVLLHTRLPLVILDPNSDFVRLGEVLADTPAPEAAKLADRDIRVFRASEGESDSLHIAFLAMPMRSRAAILQIDLLYDAEDYNAMLQFEMELVAQRSEPGHEPSINRGRLEAILRSSDDPARHRLAMRLENLGVTDWPLWSWGQRSVTEHIDENPDATVLDLGGFATSAESQSAALAVLDHLWEHREERVGRLIVIDEAHNLCTPNPETPVQKLLTERIVQIAAEGRKYGLWLLLSTQRPSKVHPNALSQCDNLALMRMSSHRDLAELAELFGYAPESLLERSPGFAQGQALFAGGFVEQPGIVQMGARLTHEGGHDVHVLLR